MVEKEPKKGRSRLCWNCDGNVPVTEQNCLYCGVYLGAAEEERSTPTTNRDLPEDELPQPLYQTAKEQVAKSPIPPSRSALFCTLCLSAGTVLFLFGLVLFLFSHEGRLTLQWDGSYWYFYFIPSLALLFFGWRSLQTVDGDEESE